ncbi:MAG: hypothetical protein ABSC49_03340 [Candidatus Microgenomates bacterium]|jgi:hypothetical protein
MERCPYRLENLFTGDKELFENVLQNRQTVFVYDIDGILANSAKAVFENFTEKTGIYASPVELDERGYLTRLATKSGLDEESIKHAEDGWYKQDILLSAHRYLYIKPLVEKTIRYYGPERNFVLTSRNPGLKDCTVNKWFPRELPKLFRTENILIRDDSNAKIDGVLFKTDSLARLAAKAPWIVFIDDDIRFVKSALENITNSLVINVLQGKTKSDFRHKRLVEIKRFPDELQAMYPLLNAIEKVIG